MLNDQKKKKKKIQKIQNVKFHYKWIFRSKSAVFFQRRCSFKLLPPMVPC